MAALVAAAGGCAQVLGIDTDYHQVGVTGGAGGAGGTGGGTGGASASGGSGGSVGGGGSSPACDDAATCTPGVPRQLAPHSTGLVTSQKPTLKWTDADKATSYLVELCSDQACATVLQKVTSTAPQAVPADPLPANRAIFWRVTAINGSFSTPSKVWVFHVGDLSAPIDTSWLGPPDFNGDGRTDVALGSAANEAYLMMNTPPDGVPATSPSQTLKGGYGFGRATANAGDINGDGLGDLIVGSYDPMSGSATVLLGSEDGVATFPQLLTGNADFGSVVGGAGDVNGDGYADIVISDGAAMRLYLGGPDGIAMMPSGPVLNGKVGGGAGDVNGDGFADVVVCDYAANSATIYHGSANGLVPGTIVTPPNGVTGMGESCITAGDTNGDGYADIIVSKGSSAQAFVFYGSPMGVTSDMVTQLPGVSGGSFGVTTTVATAGDVNGDGFADVLFGLYNGNNVVVFHGSPMGVIPQPATSFAMLLPMGQYGNSVAAAGDVDGDGFGDIVFAPSQCSGYDVFVYPGSAAGVSTGTPLRKWPTPAGSQCFGIIAR